MDERNSFETITHENKQILNEGEKSFTWLKTVCAFANTKGGTISIGVTDDLKVIGLTKELIDKQVQLFLKECKEHLEPMPIFHFDYIKTERETYVLNITIERSTQLPVTLVFHNIPSIYIRDKGRNTPANWQQIQALVLSSSTEKFDIASTSISFDINNFSYLEKKYYQATNKKITVKLLTSLNAIDQNLKVKRGLYLFSDNFLGDETLIKVTKWSGLDKGENTYQQLYESKCNILQCIDEVFEIIKNNIMSYEKKLEYTRETVYDFPLRSIFEGLVNAYAHKNYFFNNTPIEVDIFINRLEITSPGSLINNIYLYNEKNISDIQPTRRNDLICSILSNCKYMEKEGSGFDKISQDYLLYPEKYKPFVTSNEKYFKLVLPNANSFGISENKDEILSVTTPFDKNLSERDKKILGYCYEEAKTIEEIASKIQMKVSTYLRKTILGNLVNLRLLKENTKSKANIYLANRELVKLNKNNDF